MKWLPRENDLVKEQTDFRNQVWTEKGNIYISGFPGSGKSVCMLYAVKTIRDKDPNASILFVEFTHSLIKMIEAALAELELRNIPVVTYVDFERNHLGPYDYIICDEVQDMSASLLELMKQRAKRVIAGGDPNQSIYETMPNGGPTVGLDEMKRILNPKTSELTILHRLNKFIIRSINSFMPQMRMLAEKSSMLKKHKPAYVWHCIDQTDEVKRIMEDAKTALNYGESVAILLPTHWKIENFVNTYLQSIGKPTFDFSQERQYGKPNYGLLNKHLINHGVKMQSITNGFGSLVTDSDKIVLSTYHSSKGLDFDKVFMPFCNQGNGNEDDPRLFMVAMSRSRKDLTLSYTSNMNSFIQQFFNNREACQFIDFKDMAKGPNIFDYNNTLEEEEDW
ncbi:MAG: AAA family ATPase [Bacteroidales bacterium]|nr:AAA family ATPase [Bacteroidales bacterium]